MRIGIGGKKLFVLLGFIFIFITLSPCFTEDLPMRIVHTRDLLIKLDLSSQVLYLDIESDTNINSSVASAIYPISEVTDSMPRGYLDSEVKYETQIKPTIRSISLYANFDFISASILVTKAKQFDDGLYAAIENLCQQGTKRFIGKREILQLVFEALNKNDMDAEANALAYSRGLIYAAAELGGINLQTTANVPSQAEKIKTDFLKKEWQVKPVGFYTWNENLMKIFQQDRLLQQQLESAGVITALARGVTKNKRTRLAYEQYMSFLAKLTNPFPMEFCELSKVASMEKNKKYSFFPPSQSHEVDLVEKLYAHKPVPEDFNLIDTFIAQIQQRKIDLTPNDQSGWYDYQVYALEPLVVPELMPESKKLAFSINYKKELIDLFKAALALTRETHSKQVAAGLCGAANVIHIYPKLSIEPTASYYLRRAQSYGFIREVLAATFGKTDLESNCRPTPAGQASMPLWQELLDMETLFYGAYQMVCEEIGLTYNSHMLKRDQKIQQTAKEYFQRWKKTFTADADFAVDNRMMVPVFYDVQRKKIKVWTFLGYASKPLAISFQKNPTAIITDDKGNKADAFLKFDKETKSLIYPISAEVYVGKLLNREEFQTLCDENQTFSKILAALQKL